MAQDTLTLLAADGAIAVAPGVTKITKTTEGQHTLASPVASATSIELDIINGSNEIQTVTGVFNAGGGAIYTKMQFGKGGAVRLRSDADNWYIVSDNRGVTLL